MIQSSDKTINIFIEHPLAREECICKTLSNALMYKSCMVRIPSPAVFRSKDLDEFLKTQKHDSKLRGWIKEMEIALKENIYAGEQVKKRQIPSYYI